MHTQIPAIHANSVMWILIPSLLMAISLELISSKCHRTNALLRLMGAVNFISACGPFGVKELAKQICYSFPKCSQLKAAAVLSKYCSGFGAR